MGRPQASSYAFLLGLWILVGHMAVTEAVKVSVVADSVQVVRGGSALLPCSFHTTVPLDRLNIIWTVIPSSDPRHPQQVLAYDQGQVVESMSHYTGRVAFAFSPTKSATIILNDTHSQDSGTYQCSITNPPDTAIPNIGVVRLTVFGMFYFCFWSDEDGVGWMNCSKPIHVDSRGLDLLGTEVQEHLACQVPPSNPRCSSEGTTEEGGSLQFSCMEEEGVPPPTFTWEKIPPENPPTWVVSYEDDRRALLMFPNLTTDASGLYSCTTSNLLGSVSCALELRVHVAPHGPTALVVGVTLLLTMGLVLLTLFALGLWLHHSSVARWPGGREDEEDNSSHNEIRIDGFSSGRLIIAKSPAGGNPTANSVPKPLWIFTSSTPNTTYAHREWRPQPRSASQAALPGSLRQPSQGRWRSTSLSERQESSSGSEEKPSGTGAFPKPIGFLV